ncbi:hypothetical protein [Paenibacillus albus]|uniref:Uncharacterized protein n=1 Tax=Paenibacillus albus TaxID=2495582 RepID=A0A3S9A8N8_9BACL|nr:hypothetical protein [Paenibacillus albus]AZN42127.1 hypothetical protein EJC50_22420 [Paenibacillus albus]
MEKWKTFTIAMTTTFAIFGAAAYSGIKYVNTIINNPVHAEAQQQTISKPIVLPNSYTLNNFEFDFRRSNSINAQKVLYNGELTSVALLPETDRNKAIASALSTPKEVAKALRIVHAKFDETLAAYNHGAYDKKWEGYQQNADGSLSLMPDNTYDERLTNQPYVYLRMADVIGNEKAADYLRNVAALVEISVKDKDVKAVLYAHRLIHNVDSFIVGRPEEGEEAYSAAKIAESVAYMEKHQGGEG